MVRLREIPRTAAFAWSPGPAKPLVVTGTRAGAVDADFSDETNLELWDLDLDTQGQALELASPIASVSVDSKFYEIAWGPADAQHPRGIIAGGLEDGSLALWDAEKLAQGSSDALISRTTKHSGPIKAIQFNPLKPQILATAGAKGELFIFDIEKIDSPSRLGSTAARADDIECVAWNRKVSHILATGGSGGFVTVWDLKTKKASLTLNNSRKAVSSIAWDPQNSTKLLTSTPDDNAPVIFLWDLRNSNAPERTLQGHEQGVLSLSWCQQDSDLLLSAGKDNRTIVWNPKTGERYGEFPEVTNWTFLTSFNPHNPNLSATASFDGKVTIQTLQNTNPSTAQTAQQNNLDGEDFFTKAQTQPQGAAFSLPRAPAWYERPVGATFGFGGKLVTFKPNPTAAGQKRSSQIRISQFSVDSGVTAATEKFEESLKSGDLKGICESHVEQAQTEEEKSEWRVMETLVAENPRQQVIEYLGFTGEEAAASKPDEAQEGAAETKQGQDGEPSKEDGADSLWTDGADGDDFLSDLATSKGAKTDNPFFLISEGNTALEDNITKALMLGNFAQAVDICLKEDRVADAFIVANCGGKDLVDKVQTTYLAQKKGSGPSYLRLLTSVVGENLWDIVYNADLANWKETMATLCTFAKPAEFPDLCEALGDRILESGSRKDASFCFLVGSKLEKVVAIWIEELQESEQASLQEASDDSTFSVHARTLQHFIEKVTIFRQVTKFEDAETSLDSGWSLASLYDKYTEYADIVATHGLLGVAQRYLDQLPQSYPAADVARNRVKLALQKPASTAARQPATTSRTASRVQPAAAGYQPPQPVPVANAFGQPSSTPPTASNPYAPPAPNLYAPSAPGPFGQPQPPQGYQPAQPYQPAQTSAYAPQPSFGQGPPQAGPPRNGTPSALPPPPKTRTELGTWNDTPVVGKAPARRSTPRAAPVTSPFPNQPGMTSPPTAGSPFGAQAGVTSPPPPPKGPAPPRMTSPPTTGPPPGPASIARPSSTAASAYAPPPQASVPPPTGSPAVPRTGSPYNAPPGAAPPSNRYAPAPAPAPVPQQYAPPQAQLGMVPPPAASRPPPAASPYAPVPQQQPPPGPQAPSPYQPQPSQVGPPGAPPMGRPPAAGPPPAAAGSAATPPPPRAAPPPKARHPAGDRSHIPPNAQRLVEVLDRDMQRVSAQAPASFAPQVRDTQKRLNLLFDHLNNEELVKPDTVEQLIQLADAIENKAYDVARNLQVEIQKNKTEECGNWMVGVKRLISMSKATP